MKVQTANDDISLYKMLRIIQNDDGKEITRVISDDSSFIVEYN